MRMNKNFVLSALLLIGLNISGYAWSKEQTIGFIDREQIMTKTLYAKDMQELGKKQFKSKAESLEAKQKKILAEKESLERDRDILAEADLKKRVEKLQTEANTFGLQQEEFAQEAEAFEAKYHKKMSGIFEEVVGQLAKENNLEIVLPSEVALHGSKKFDYTFRAVELMDKKFKEAKS